MPRSKKSIAVYDASEEVYAAHTSGMTDDRMRSAGMNGHHSAPSCADRLEATLQGDTRMAIAMLCYLDGTRIPSEFGITPRQVERAAKKAQGIDTKGVIEYLQRLHIRHDPLVQEILDHTTDPDVRAQLILQDSTMEPDVGQLER